MINSVLSYLISILMKFIPETRFFGLKKFLYCSIGCEIGTDTRICSSVKIYGAKNVRIGSGVWIGPDTMIVASTNITIEDNVDIAPRVYIGTGTHIVGDIMHRMAGSGLSKSIIIKRGTWIGTNALIQPGVVIEEMSIVNSGAVVTKNFPSYSLLAGVPAKFIKDLRLQ